MIDTNRPIAELVLDHPACARVLSAHRIDFCCSGRRSLSEAAMDRGLKLEQLLAELETALRESNEYAPDFRSLTTGQLVAHIVDKHHTYLRETLPFLEGLAVKVQRVHGATNPKLRDLERCVHELSCTLSRHVDDEERDLFPTLLNDPERPHDIEQLLSEMTAEHAQVASLLARVREASDEFRTPSHACMSYRTLFAELERLEADTFRHVHLENHVLKARFTH